MDCGFGDQQLAVITSTRTAALAGAVTLALADNTETIECGPGGSKWQS
jgi:hypothetical protein